MSSVCKLKSHHQTMNLIQVLDQLRLHCLLNLAALTRTWGCRLIDSCSTHRHSAHVSFRSRAAVAWFCDVGNYSRHTEKRWLSLWRIAANHPSSSWGNSSKSGREHAVWSVTDRIAKRRTSSLLSCFHQRQCPQFGDIVRCCTVLTLLWDNCQTAVN